MVEEGTRGIKEWKGNYDFAVDGGAASMITLRSNDGSIPNDAVILGGWLDVQTILASLGLATGALQCQAANDVVNQAAFDAAPFSSTGRKSVIPVFTGATSLRNTAARDPKFVIGTAALTGGKFELVLFYR